MRDIKIKKTVKNDIKFYYELRNNIKNRKLFVNSENIKFKDHKSWFKKNYIKNYYFTCYLGTKKIGYIRGDNLNDIIYISIVINNKFRKKNIATECFNLFEKKIKNNFIFLSKILKKNNASIKFFKKNKFSLLKKDNKTLTYYKIHHKNSENYLNAISKIEDIRRGNNINWMNILRIAFTSAPSETSKIFKKIYNDDKAINQLSKKLF